MSLANFISNIFMPGVNLVFSLFDQCIGMFFDLKLFGISIGVVAITILFVAFILYKIFGGKE